MGGGGADGGRLAFGGGSMSMADLILIGDGDDDVGAVNEWIAGGGGAVTGFEDAGPPLQRPGLAPNLQNSVRWYYCGLLCRRFLLA